VAEAGKRARRRRRGAERVRAFVKAGQPARTIVEFAASTARPDRRRQPRARLGRAFLLGSVSHKVTGLAECPVLVV
jgi:nucleotide-binding universal stress UspA family protein